MYIHTTTLEQVDEQALRELFPTTSFPQPFLPPDNYVLVTPSPQPAFDPVLQRLEKGMPVLTTPDQYSEQWLVVNIYATQGEEIAAQVVRLAELKLAKNNEINRARLHASYDTFVYANKVISCDALSRSDIETTNGWISLHGTLPENWFGAWKTTDNTYVGIASVDEWKAFYSAMFDTGNANFTHAQQLKATLETATTAEEVAAIHW